jgi:hypothetical protein
VAQTNAPLYCATVLVTTGVQSLLTLIQASNTKNAGCAASCRSYQLQIDPASTNNVFVGDELLATGTGLQMAGLNMPAGSGFLDRSSVPGMCPIGSLYVKTAAGTSLLNVMVFGE